VPTVKDGRILKEDILQYLQQGATRGLFLCCIIITSYMVYLGFLCFVSSYIIRHK